MTLLLKHYFPLKEVYAFLCAFRNYKKELVSFSVTLLQEAHIDPLSCIFVPLFLLVLVLKSILKYFINSLLEWQFI